MAIIQPLYVYRNIVANFYADQSGRIVPSVGTAAARKDNDPIFKTLNLRQRWRHLFDNKAERRLIL